MTQELFNITETLKQPTTETPFTKIQISRGPSKQFIEPIITQLPADLNEGQKAVYNYVWKSLSSKIPRLIPFAFESPAVFNMAKFLKRHLSGSLGTCYIYVKSVKSFCDWIGKTPDEIIAECRDSDNVPNQKALFKYSQLVDDFIGALQENYSAPNTVANYAKGIKSLFLTNGLKLSVLGRLSSKVVNKDRAPKPEELQKLIDIGDLREKVIVSWLSLGGFRVGTLAKLKYSHVKEDLEKNVTPIHVHVEAAIVKGKYGDYDTFIAEEGVTFLKAYLDYRRRGHPKGYSLPETITDNSPLIRNARSRIPQHVEPWQISQIIRTLFFKSGLITVKNGSRHQVRPHSIRRFFRTQLEALGVDRDYVEYMMGHKIDRYHDIQMKGTEFLRNIYMASGLSIRPKTHLSKIESLKEIIRAWGMNPDQILTQQALTMPHATIVTEESQVTELSRALKEMMKKELLNAK
jgi:integrase